MNERGAALEEAEAELRPEIERNQKYTRQRRR
jgi:hypothetical protein